MISSDQVARICKRKDKLKSARGTWETHWQDVSNYFMPNQADFNVKRSKGDRRHNLVFDSTGIHANEMLAAALHGMLTNPASEWFSLRLLEASDDLEDQAEVKQYLEDATQTILTEIHAPEVAFSSHIHEYYECLTSIGTSALFIGEATRRDGLLFRNVHLSELCIAENSDGVVDTVYRNFKMTLRQVVQEFGEDQLSENLQRMWERKDYDREVEILHAVYPRDDAEPNKARADMLPIASVYIYEKDKAVLYEGGFDEMPYMVTRWSKSIGEVFGRSPAMTALPDVKMLQEMWKTTIKAAQKVADPPLLVPDDGVIGPVRTIPGGLNYYRSSVGARIEPLMTGANIPISMEMMNEVRDRIRLTFYMDQLQFPNSPSMTATEVMERTERTLRLLGPILGRLQSEFLGPMIARIYGILERQGRLPPAPELLEGQEIKIEYVSPLARAQRQAETQGIIRTIEMAAPIAGFDPNAVRVIKGAETVRHVAGINGVSPNLLYTDEEIAQMVAAEQQMQQAAQAMQLMQQGANVAKTAGEVIGGQGT